MQKFLVVVDMQNDFIDGSLGTPEAQAIVPRVLRKIEYFKKMHYPIFATMDTHTPDYLETAEGKSLPVEHCIVGTEGIKIHPDIDRALNRYEHLFIIPKFSFGSVFLPKRIESEKVYDESMSIELVGLCTDICVVSNALILKAHFYEHDITVDSLCCAGTTPEKHNAALEVMRSCQINVI